MKSGRLYTFSGWESIWPPFFFSHNLCFKCPNGSCEYILNIYVLISFQWYKKIFNPMGINFYNCSLEIRKSIKTPTPKVGAHLGVWGFILSLSSTLENIRCASHASPLSRTLTSPCLGREPKARVMTLIKASIFLRLSVFPSWRYEP
jgi:hypothetical protein